jgi:hypothetical protein
MFARLSRRWSFPMLVDELVFSVEEEPYRWRDVILAAAEAGEWHAAMTRARHGAACVKHAEVTGDPLAPGALDAAGREFRYARDLVTAASMEAWLARWGLSAKDWTGHIRRALQRARWLAMLDVLAERYPLGNDEATRIALIDAVCTGDLFRWARGLAGRAAAARAVATDGSEEPADNLLDERVIQEALVSATLLGTDTALLEDAMRRIQRVDHSFERFRATHITEPALHDFVGSRQLDWVRFDCRIMAFPEVGMAAEAALLLREDGEGFTGVYSVAHTLPRAAHFFFDEIDGPMRDQFLGAQRGDLVGPVQTGDEYALYLIEEKTLPSARDPRVRARAEEAVLKHALDQQVDRRVHWHVTP